ncbi:MAG: transglycosylase family protein [Actinobacteria bacterium]|nr:transglycosylase family protein [Actinomycetota bacterium]
MAPSTGSTRKPATPVTLSTKRAPSGPGVPPIPPYTMSAAEQDFFACVVFRESSGNPSAINDSSGAAGLFQFLQSTWDATARHVGRGDLVGVNPALAPVDLQWWMAHMLFLWQGPSPWASDGCRYVPPSPATTPSTAPPTSPPPPTTTRPESTTTTAGRTTTTSSR